MEDFSILLFGALATWRLTKMIMDERLPFGIGIWIRRHLGGILHEDDGTVAIDTDGSVLIDPNANALTQEIGHLLSCFWCCSIWIAALLVLPLLPLTNVGTYITTTLAFSGAAIFIDRCFERVEGESADDEDVQTDAE